MLRFLPVRNSRVRHCDITDIQRRIEYEAFPSSPDTLLPSHTRFPIDCRRLIYGSNPHPRTQPGLNHSPIPAPSFLPLSTTHQAMGGCLQALRFWRKKSKTPATPFRYSDEKPRSSETESIGVDLEKPPLEGQRAHYVPPAFRGVPVRSYVNPVYSAYSTPVDTRWADSTFSKTPIPYSDDPKLKDEGVDDPEEAARRRKAEQEEQERLDFFQMM